MRNINSKEQNKYQYQCHQRHRYIIILSMTHKRKPEKNISYKHVLCLIPTNKGLKHIIIGKKIFVLISQFIYK